MKSSPVLSSGVVILLTVILAMALPPTAQGSDHLARNRRTPAFVRLPTDIYAELETYAEQIRQAEGVPGMAYAIVENDQVVYTKGFGVREQHGVDPVNAYTTFMIGSTSKAFTTALAAILVDEGRLRWNDRVIQHVPCFQLMDPWVTREFIVEDLFSQRSGMPAYSLDFMSMIGYDGHAIQHALRYVEPVSSTRTRFAYVNNLFLTGAAIIEKVSGFSWADNLDRRIFGPLGMASSTVDPDVAFRMGNLAREHTPDGAGGLWTVPLDWPYRGWLQTYAPAGGIYSNVMDMTQWIRAQLGSTTVAGQPLVSAINLAHLHAPKTPAACKESGIISAYCLAWVYESFSPHPIVWHNGETIGNHSIVSLVPEAGIGIVVLTNTSGNKVPERLAKRYFNLYFGNPLPDESVSAAGQILRAGVLADRDPIPPAPPNKGPALPHDAYVGRFANPAYGVFEAVVRGGQLRCLVGPVPFEARLEPYSGNTFTFSLPDFPGSECLATFRIGPDGTATELVVDFCADASGGIFRRIR